MQYPDWWGSAEPDVHAAVVDFSEWIRNKVSNIKPHELVAKKNPFLFRARAPDDADELAARLLNAFLSSSEETRFGEILHATAIAVCFHAKGGWKSSTAGIDLEYDENSIRTVVQIKSSENWGNSSQRKKLVTDFQHATKTLRQGQGVQVRCVEGICYGPSRTKDFGSHMKLVGNVFWFEVSGWEHTGRAVMNIVAEHAGNGLSSLIGVAQESIVAYLREVGVVTAFGSIDWDCLYDLVMKSKSP